MRHEKVTVVLLLAIVLSAAEANAVADGTGRGLVVVPEPTSMTPRAPAFRSTVAAAAQDPSAVEAALGLDRPTRRVIQQGLRSEGFDPGEPDGLFGPRTRGAIRRWQEAQGLPASGYLDGAQADLLRAVGSARPAGAGQAPRVGSQTAGAYAPEPQRTANCEGWNTEMFFEAATVERVTACLAAGTDPRAPDDDGVTPLHWAAWSNEAPAAVRALLAAGADPEAETVTGWTAPHQASADMQISERGALPRVLRSEEGTYTPLSLAVWNNENPAVIEALLSAGANPRWRARDGRTLLHFAAQHNSSPAVVAALVAAGVDVTARDDAGLTPLHRGAAGTENPAVIGALLAAGADLLARNGQNRDATPLEYAAINNVSVPVIEALVDAGAEPTTRVLRSAASRNANPAILETLMDAAGADIATIGEELFSSAMTNTRAMTEWFLAAGVDVTVRVLEAALLLNENPAVVEALVATGLDVNGGGFEPFIFWAVKNITGANARIVELLLAAGADATVRNYEGATPLHDASTAGAVRALVAAGADVNARNNTGNTALHSAHRATVIEALVAAGANVDSRNQRGRTPLHSAVDGGTSNADGETVTALVAAGASVDARDENGWTPLHRAATRRLETYEQYPILWERQLSREQERFEALIAAGANIEARDGRGETPLHLAARPASDFYRTSSFVDTVPHFGHAIEALLDAGANASALNEDDQTPWDLAQANDALRGSDGYWRLNDARFNTTNPETRRQTTTPRERRPSERSGPSRRQGPGCEIRGYPALSNLRNLGLNWCSSSVDFQRRVFALQAAGAWCAIAGGSSSAPDQINARHQEINAACDMLDAFAAQGGPSCRCPTGYRP